MTVIVRIEKGRPEYDSLNSMDELTEEKIEKANELNQLIRLRIEEYLKTSKIQEKKKDRAIYYWEIGVVLRDIFFNSGLIIPEEKDLFFKNVRIHLNKEIFPGDDFKRNRNIPEQFFRLAGYSKELMEKVQWTTWSYIFDSPILSRNQHFDNWFSKTLSTSTVDFDQNFSRLWAQSFNTLFNNIDSTSWSDEDFLKVIESLFLIVKKVKDLNPNIESKLVKEGLKKAIQDTRTQFILLKMGEISKQDYITMVLTKFEENNKQAKYSVSSS